MQPTTPSSIYCHPLLIENIQEPQPEHDAAVRAVHEAEVLVRDKRQELVQAEQQLTREQAKLQQTLPAQQQRRQLVRKLQLMQRACWNRSLSAELDRMILSKTSRYNTRMVAVSCPLLREAATAAEPIIFEASPWSRMRIAAGGSHTLCVSADGTIFAWGGNANGELGVGDREKRVVPAPVTGLLRNKSVVQVSAGLSHTACLSADGLLFTWGGNCAGQLGVGDDENRIVPTLVPALKGTQVVQVAAGTTHTLCVTANGLVLAFGFNGRGQLGVGDTAQRPTPIPVSGELKNKAVLQVAAGSDHSACVTADGSVFSWGKNSNCQLGIGDTQDRAVPTVVAGGELQGKLAVQVAAGESHTVCLTVEGILVSWGNNWRSQLGVGDDNIKTVPALVKGLQGERVLHVSVGQHHTTCTTIGGSVFTWGAGDNGKLGLGDNAGDRSLPTLARGELRNKRVLQLATGSEHSVCVTKDGSVYGWGCNGMSQLGVANRVCADLPILVQAFDSNPIL